MRAEQKIKSLLSNAARDLKRLDELHDDLDKTIVSADEVKKLTPASARVLAEKIAGTLSDLVCVAAQLESTAHMVADISAAGLEIAGTCLKVDAEIKKAEKTAAHNRTRDARN